MKAVDLYSECKEFTYGIKVMFNYFDRYAHCVSTRCFTAEMNDILRRIALAYRPITMGMGTDIVFNNIMIKTDSDDMETIAEGNPLFIDQVTESMERYRDNIIATMHDLDEQKQLTCLANFENCFKASKQWINRMEMMLRNSQHIRQTYLKAA